MLTMSTLQERIRKVLASGFSQADLARITGKSTAAVTFWANGKTLELKADTALDLEEGTGFRARWLTSGRGPEKVREIGINPNNTLLPSGSNSLRLLPLVTWEKGDEMLGIQNNELNLNAETELLTAPGVQSPHAKFFVMPDDAMAPDILRGEYVALDPKPKPLRGDYVLVKQTRTGELMLRQYRPVDSEEFNAVPLNTSKFDPFNSRQHGLELLAVLVGHWSGRRSDRH